MAKIHCQPSSSPSSCTKEELFSPKNGSFGWVILCAKLSRFGQNLTFAFYLWFCNDLYFIFIWVLYWFVFLILRIGSARVKVILPSILCLFISLLLPLPLHFSSSSFSSSFSSSSSSSSSSSPSLSRSSFLHYLFFFFFFFPVLNLFRIALFLFDSPPFRRAFPIRPFDSPPLPGTMMLRLHRSPIDRGYLSGTTPCAPACRRECPVPSERRLHREFCQIIWYLPRSSACRRVRPVPSEQILHREFCQGSPIGDPRWLAKSGTEERVGDGHRTDRTGLSHHRRSRSTRCGLGQWERGPCSTTNRTEPTKQGSSSVELAPYRGAGV